MKKVVLSFLLLNLVGIAISQELKNVSLEDIWKNYTFYARTVSGIRSLNNGVNYTSLQRVEIGNDVIKYSYTDGDLKETMIKNADLMHDEKVVAIDDYDFSADESKALIASNTESIYRYSSKSDYFIYELASKKLSKLADGEKQMYATFSPKANKVAYVKNNNLYFKDLSGNKEVQITNDGKEGSIINGASDWVYEEELTLVQAFKWSPDGTKIAFYKFDESNVKEWSLKYYNELYPDEVRFKYPKAGEANSKVDIYVYDLLTNKTIKADIGNDYEYIIRINWTNDSEKLAIQSMNRHQSKLKMHLVDINSNSSELVYEETHEKYVEIPTTIFLSNKDQFLITSEKDGYNHMYLYDIKGKLIKQITNGKWEITEIYGVDEKSGTVYYQSSEMGAISRDVYSIKLNGSSKKRLSNRRGVSAAEFSKTYKYFINTNSSASIPYYVSVNDNSGKELRILVDNKGVVDRLKGYDIAKKEFTTLNINNHQLNAWVMKPSNFDENKKYPLFMFVYGGDGRQTVMDEWDSFNYFWFQHLVSQGYVVVSVDNRGTEGNGAEFRKSIYKQLGKYETEDQIEVAKYFAGLSYIDGSRVGIFGWSFGGYLSTSCLLKGADVFKTAIAVAPVTNWRFYDNIYTERYMQTPQENPDGYDENSPINHVEKLKGNYLLIHGMADDNVHYQNTAEMTNALINANKQFTQFSYPNKNHGIYGGNTRLHLYQMMTDYLLRNL
ncbi:MAG: S9 family peptidase [Flavobacteriales bacterium]|nr:S9 family peptidase [Flavobacteriales bacterium]MCB9334674.1 S9 family peptidase [Flavobacteriales bacterium]